MKQLACEMCGSTDMLKEGGVFVCQSCGCKYSVEEAKKMMIEGKVEIQGSVEIDRAKDLDKILQQIFFYIENDQFQSPDLSKLLDEASKIDSTNTTLSLAKLLVHFNCNSLKKLAVRVSKKDILNNIHYKFIIQYANEELQTEVRNAANGNLDINIYMQITDGWLSKELAEKIYSNATKIELPGSVKTLGYAVFKDFKNLQEIIIPNGIEKIESSTFKGCSSLTKINIPSSVKVIDDHAFEDCTLLAEVNLPNGLERIEWCAFQNCTSLGKINIPTSVTEIGRCSFHNTGFIGIVIPNNISEVPASCFSHCKKLTAVILPSNIRKIDESAFSFCDNLSKVYIGNIEAKIRAVGHAGGTHYSLGPLFSHIVVGVDAFRFSPCVIYEKPESSASTSGSSTTSYRASTTARPTTTPSSSSSGGCYVATCVYGSYDCPEVWTLRRYRDDTLGATWYGRLFIHTYYAISPTLVKWFGHTKWFKKFWHSKLDRMVAKLQSNGVENTPYKDKEW